MRIERTSMVKSVVFLAIFVAFFGVSVAGAASSEHNQSHQVTKAVPHVGKLHRGKHQKGDLQSFLKSLSASCESDCCWAECSEPGGFANCSSSGCEAGCPDGSYASVSCEAI